MWWGGGGYLMATLYIYIHISCKAVLTTCISLNKTSVVLVNFPAPPPTKRDCPCNKIIYVSNDWFEQFKLGVSKMSSSFTLNVGINWRKESSCFRVYAIYYFIFHFGRDENCAVACRARSLSWWNMVRSLTVRKPRAQKYFSLAKQHNSNTFVYNCDFNSFLYINLHIK